MAWIKLINQVPEHQSEIIVYDKDIGVCAAKVYLFAGFDIGKARFYCLQEETDDALELSHVTHWQPFPDKPKEDE